MGNKSKTQQQEKIKIPKALKEHKVKYQISNDEKVEKQFISIFNNILDINIKLKKLILNNLTNIDDKIKKELEFQIKRCRLAKENIPKCSENFLMYIWNILQNEEGKRLESICAIVRDNFCNIEQLEKHKCLKGQETVEEESKGEVGQA